MCTLRFDVWVFAFYQVIENESRCRCQADCIQKASPVRWNPLQEQAIS